MPVMNVKAGGVISAQAVPARRDIIITSLNEELNANAKQIQDKGLKVKD